MTNHTIFSSGKGLRAGIMLLSVLTVVVVTMAIGASSAYATSYTINFDNVNGTTPISGHPYTGSLITNQYASSGASFISGSNPAIATNGCIPNDPQSCGQASSSPNWLVGNNGGSGYADSYYPITMHVVDPVNGGGASSINLMLISVGSAGLDVTAYNASGQIVDSWVQAGSGTGAYRHNQIQLDGNGIVKVTFVPRIQAIPREDGFGIDDVSITFTNTVTPACSANSDCGTSGFTGNNFCQGNSVYRNYVTYTCNNPGTATASCTNSTQAILAQQCSGSQTCANGACTNTQTTCNFNSDCGTNGYIGQPFCQGNSVYVNYVSYTCNNPGTPNATCSNTTQAQLSQQCTSSQTCQNGTCATAPQVACNTNTDCGTAGFTGSPFCQGNAVYKNYTTYTCNNPGTQSAYCTNSTQAQQQQVCSGSQTCSGGTCSQSTGCSVNGTVQASFNFSRLEGSPNPRWTTGTQILNSNWRAITSSNGTAIIDPVFTNAESFWCRSDFQKIECYGNNSTTTQRVHGTISIQGGTFTNVQPIADSKQSNNYGSISMDIQNSDGSSDVVTITSPTTIDFRMYYNEPGDSFVAYYSGTCPTPTVCSTNSECGTSGFTGSNFCQGNSVYRNYVTYTCNNPGTANASCTNSTQAQLAQTCASNQTCSNGTCNTIQSACTSNGQCGTSGVTGSPFCQGNAIYVNYTQYTCNNPGTASAYCSQQTNAQLQSTCVNGQTCANGSCVTIACSTNSECGTSGFTGSNFCQGNSVYKNYTTYTCNNPGTQSSYCSQNTQAQQQQACTTNQTCSNGTCNTIQSVCTSNGQCGTSGVTGSPFCQGNAIYVNYTQYTCNNPGTASAYCTQQTQSQVQSNCANGQTCSGGSCVTIACSTNSECGTSGLTGSAFCQGNSVYKNYTTYTCNNPGTQSSYCSQNTQAQVQQACTTNQTCSNGTCNTIQAVCNSSSDCGVSGFTGSNFCQGNSVYRNYRTYTCNNPGTANASCTNTTQAQLAQTCTTGQTCSGGSCVTVACNSNSDCGTSGVTGSAFCQGNSVYKNYITYTCNNPGTASASCTNSTQAQVQQTCTNGQACSNGTCGQVACSTNSDCGTSGLTGSAFCQGNSVYKNYITYTCNNPGTVGAYCTNATQAQQQNTCTSGQTCTNGSCTTIACNTNSDCGTNGFSGSAFCQGNSVYRNYITYTCNNAGTATASCSNTTQAQQQSTCTGSQTCSGGSCVTVACNSNADCGTSGLTGSAFCQGNSVYKNYITYTCNNPGTASASCTNSTQAQVQQTCTSNQTCSNGSCTTIACNSNADCGTSANTGSPFCQGNAVYQNRINYTCNNAGTASSYCSSTTQAQLSQTCSGNQICSGNACVNQVVTANLTVTKTVRNLSTGNLNWTSSVYATPGDILQFNVNVQAASTQGQVGTIVLRDYMPANLTFHNSVTVDGAPTAGDVTQGLNLGQMSSGQTKTVTYQVQVAQAQNFQFGTTTLNNSVSATATPGGTSNTSTASVIVSRTQVGGATTVSTGLTNNFWIDSFFLPLILALLLLWLYQSGILNSLGFVEWFNTRKAKGLELSAHQKLQQRIAQIRNKESK